MKKIFATLIGISVLTSAVFAKQGMSAWSGPGEVQNPDYIAPRRSTPKKTEEPKPKKEEPKPVKKEEPKVEPKKEEPAKEEIKAEPKKVESDEYSRSVGNLSISKDTFEADKKEIMAMISELSVIMKDKNYTKWLNYIDSETSSYWSKPANLKKAQARMPVKGIQLKTMQDYFKYIFVPARQKSKITEIRYESDIYVKAVEVQDDEDLIYYYFKKINGKWLVHIPAIID